MVRIDSYLSTLFTPVFLTIGKDGHRNTGVKSVLK
jgi:hypothetical protein